jgi:serine/threonine protein kinase
VLTRSYAEAVNAAMKSENRGLQLRRLYEVVKNLSSENTVKFWANDEDLWMSGPPLGDTTGLFNLCLFDGGNGLVPLLAKTLGSGEARAMVSFLRSLAEDIADVGTSLLPSIHPGLVPFSLLKRQSSDQLLQLMPVYPLSLDRFSGEFSAKAALAIFTSLSECLTFLHGTCRTLHCDVKPANIALDPEGRAILIDTGSLVRVGEVCRSCTWIFLPRDAEQWLKGEASAILNADARIDWWMLAVTMRGLLMKEFDHGRQPLTMKVVVDDLANCDAARLFWPTFGPLLVNNAVNKPSAPPVQPQATVEPPIAFAFSPPSKSANNKMPYIPDRFLHVSRSPNYRQPRARALSSVLEVENNSSTQAYTIL